jgi:hypothetical protein
LAEKALGRLFCRFHFRKIHCEIERNLNRLASACASRQPSASTLNIVLKKAKKKRLHWLKAKGNDGRPAHSKYALDAGGRCSAGAPKLAKDGRGAPVIAERLKRSQGAVYNRARKLGVTLKRAAAEGIGEMK